MVARLPQPGGDEGQWGDVLNTFLAVSHNSDGTLKANSVTTSVLSNGTVNKDKIATSAAPTSGQALTYNGTDLAWTTISASGSVPDATSSVKGVVQLAGDLAGTAAAPTVPGLAAKATDSAVVHLTGNETVTGTKNFTGTLQSGGVTVVTTSDARLTDQRTPSDLSVTTAKLQTNSVTTLKIIDDAVTEPKLAASNTPTNGQLLSFNGTNFTWVAAPAGGADPVMGGDISGNASNAQIIADAVGTNEIANLAVTGGKIADNTITEPKLAVSNSPSSSQVLTWNGSALAWTTPATGGGSPDWAITPFTPTGVNSPVYPTAGQWLIIDNSTFSSRVFLPANPSANDKVLVKLKTSYPSSGQQAIVFVGDTNSYPDPLSGTALTLNSSLSAAEFRSDGTDWFVISRYDS